MSSLSEDLPLPLFRPRSNLTSLVDDGIFLHFLNLNLPLSVPMDWHPPKLEIGTRLELLNLHYMEYLEALDDDLFQAVITDWISNNPPYRENYWLDDWNCYSLSIRVVVWMQQFAQRRKKMDVEFEQFFLRSMLAQLLFLEQNLELDIGGNHLIKNIKALLWAGSFFTGNLAERWSKCGLVLLMREISEQVLPDGMHYERSPAYHCQVFADLLECYKVMPEGEEKLALSLVLERMAQVSIDLTHPDGLISLFNDGGLHMTYLPMECLQIYKQINSNVPKGQSVIELPESGYYGWRKDTDLILIDCGKVAPDFLPAHGQGDIFSFEWSISGQRVIIDTGTYEYHSGKRRSYSRSSRAHNTVTLDGKDQCEFYGSFRCGRRAKVECIRFERNQSGIVLEGRHDGYKYLIGKPIHYRLFKCSAGRLEIIDRIEGGGGQNVQARLLLAPEFNVIQSDSNWVISDGVIKVILLTRSSVKIVSVYWFPDFGRKIKSIQLTIEYGAAPCEGGFILQSIDSQQWGDDAIRERVPN